MKRIIYILIASMAFTACGDFLEPKDNSEFVPRTAGSLNELLLGSAYPRVVGRLHHFLALLDDDVTAAPWQDRTNKKDEREYWAPYTWQSDMYLTMDKYGSDANIYKPHYTVILGTNAILDYVGDVTGEQSEIDYVRAQALTLRAFYYFRLVNIFGHPYNSDKKAPGVPLKLNSGVEMDNLARNTVEEVYNQVIADLLEAEALYESLPAAKQWKADFRTSLPMVQLLLSRTYLYMEEWALAAEYAGKVIGGRFKLLDLNAVPTVSAGNRYYLNYHNYENSPEAIWLYGSPGDVGYFFTSTFSGALYSSFMASEELRNSFGEDDLRSERYIVRHATIEIVNSNGELEPFPYPYNKMSVSNTNFGLSSGTTIFARSLRLSEAYLNLAEAKAMLYKKAGDGAARMESLTALNTLRRNRFAPDDYVSVDFSDADELITFIREERRRELCLEDHRWFDLRRWGMPELTHTWYPAEGETQVYTLQAGDPSYTIPLPPDALELNAELRQNPLAPAPRIN